jgi:hypothetical protein
MTGPLEIAKEFFHGSTMCWFRVMSELTNNAEGVRDVRSGACLSKI